MINMWIRGSTTDNVPPLWYLIKANAAHIKNGAGFLSKIKQVIKRLKNLYEIRKYGSHKVSGVAHNSLCCGLLYGGN